MAEYIGSLKIIDEHELLDLVTHTPSPPKNKQIKTKESKKIWKKILFKCSYLTQAI